jgi:hypothetical protein
MLHALRTYPAGPGPPIKPLSILHELRSLAEASGNWLGYVLGWTVFQYNRSIDKDGATMPHHMRPCPELVETELGVNADVFFQAVEARANFIHCRSTAIVELAVKCPGMYQCKTFNDVPLILWYLRPPAASISPDQIKVLREKGVFWAALLASPVLVFGRHE